MKTFTEKKLQILILEAEQSIQALQVQKQTYINELQRRDLQTKIDQLTYEDTSTCVNE